MFPVATDKQIFLILLIGLNIAASDLSRKSFVWSNVLFSLASPIGILIGIAIADLPDSLASVSVIFLDRLYKIEGRRVVLILFIVP